MNRFTSAAGAAGRTASCKSCSKSTAITGDIINTIVIFSAWTALNIDLLHLLEVLLFIHCLTREGDLKNGGCWNHLPEIHYRLNRLYTGNNCLYFL